jgi:hypothetical protein
MRISGRRRRNISPIVHSLVTLRSPETYTDFLARDPRGGIEARASNAVVTRIG